MDPAVQANLDAICAEDFEATVWVVRHGERIDQIDPSWIKTASQPFDPPLTSTGLSQAFRCGESISLDLHPSTKSGITPLTRILTSPFYRCLQTSASIMEGLANTTPPTAVPPLSLEPGLSEWLAQDYFDTPLPYDPFTYSNRQLEFPQLPANAGSYTPSFPNPIPSWPEAYETMRTRLLTTFAHAVQQCCQPSQTGLVLVSHGAGCMAIVEEVMNAIGGGGGTFKVESTPYCCISMLVKKKGTKEWKAERVADVSHLGDLLKVKGLEFVVRDAHTDPAGGGADPTGH